MRGRSQVWLPDWWNDRAIHGGMGYVRRNRLVGKGRAGNEFIFGNV